MNRKTISLTFTESLEDQALLGAICQTSAAEHRTPRTRQAKYLLSMALGLRPADPPMRMRLRAGQMTSMKDQRRGSSSRAVLKLVRYRQEERCDISEAVQTTDQNLPSKEH